jgi:predicted membrane protein
MEVQNSQNEEMWQKMEKTHRRGKILSGLLVLAIGSLFLARELGAEFPSWLFTWKMLLIGIGLVIGFKHRFRNMSWLILIAIGGTFLVSDLYPEMHLRPILWPVLLIIIGLVMVFKPRNKHCGNRRNMRKKWREGNFGAKDAYISEDYSKKKSSAEDVMDSTCIFSETKKSSLSKNFKGGVVVNIFGGTELNLMQADFEETAKLDIEQVFGGTKLLIPAHWGVKSELVTIFGSLEDKRPAAANGIDKPKTLILTGTSVFGGIDIRSY